MVIKNFIKKNSVSRAITAFFLGTGFYILLLYCPPILFSIFLCTIMMVMISELKNIIKETTRFLILLPFYPIIPCLILIYFNQTPEYKNLLLYLFMIVVSFDSGSYLTGKICSKLWTTLKIVPSISPGKSWEGACGGYLISTLLLLITMYLDNKILSWHILALSAIICTIAFTGDIFESYLKRSANLKDSGTLLPGHGGFLDRFDAILFVSYFFFIFKDYLLKLLK